MSQLHKFLFLIASQGRARLVRQASGGRFVTVLQADQAMSVEELARQARHILAQDHLEGLVIVAPEAEFEAIRTALGDLLVIVGVLAADLYERPDADLPPLLDRALHAPWPDR